MKKLILTSITLCSSLTCAADFTHVRLETLNAISHANHRVAAKEKVAVIAIKLSPALQELQKSRSQFKAPVTRNAPRENIPSHVDLGMNNVPVFNQGPFGTCNTFATTAAIDAALGKGDYISQLCLLQLSSYLSDYSYWGNAWHGAWSHVTLSLIRQFGVVSKQDQKQGVCNNVVEYPFNYDETFSKHKLSLSNYHQYSHNILSSTVTRVPIEPQTLFKLVTLHDQGTTYYATVSDNSDGWVTPELALSSVRKSLADGNRVIIAFLTNSKYMLTGRKNVNTDSWFVDHDMIVSWSTHDPQDNGWGYHEIVLYGYDDNATALNSEGEKQTGVFLVRNSWGRNRPEFMTYDYFKLMVVDAYSINTGTKPS